jgi:hypothetical protein
LKVAVNDFARGRHLADAPYSHYEGSFDQLCRLVEQNLDKMVVLADDKDGKVIKVTLPGDGFFAAVTQARSGMSFKAHFDSRDSSEHPYFSIKAADGPKVPAAEADLILYSHGKLAVKNEHSTDAEWEIVSINAKRTTGDEPPHPVTMMRNQKDYPGGTKTDYTPEQWADSVEYWIGGGPNPPFVMLE